ncbi:MAG: hypothetical protein IKE17_03175 [Clostridia bacterium]|nr:hypothetical protein [Clostridia bacterium]
MSNCLFENLFGGTQAGVLNIWARHDQQRRKPSLWFDLSSTDALEKAEAEALALDAQGFDVFFAVGLAGAPIRERLNPKTGRVTKNPRVSAEDITVLPAYFLDLDTLADSNKEGKRIPMNPSDALERLLALPCPPSACVLSGHGLHAYWLLAPMIQVNEDNREALASALRAFAHSVAGAISCPDLDTFASEPARVLRVPGTHNHKHGEALPVELAQGCTWKRYSTEELDTWAASETARVLQTTAEGAAINPSPEAQTSAEAAGARVSVDDSPSADYIPGGKYYLTDEQIWTMLARRDSRITALRNGDISDYDSDHSRADQAMCNALAFATGRNPARMDQLFRQTMLYRDKWDKEHYANGNTYGEGTIRKACADTKQLYRGKDYLLDKLAEERRQAFEKVREAYDKASGSGYIVEPFRTCAQKVNANNGETTVEPLADFVAVPVEDIRRDDGAEARREFILEGYNYRGALLPRINVLARDLSTFRWVEERWPGAVIEPGNAKRDKLRAAILKAARVTARQRTVFSHSGWREIGDLWAFLYNGGAIGAEGVSVELPGALADYRLPESIPEESARELARASLELLNLAPRRVTLPLLASMYLAPLCEWFAQAGEPVTHVLVVQGKTQTKKSVLSSLFLNHFGTAWSYQNLPFNFQSTANAIREGIFLAKDLPAIVDDFHPTPTGARNSAAVMTQTAQDLARAWGDHAARQRMNSDQTLRTAKPARGLGIFTAEYVPDLGESGLSRVYVAPLNPGEVDNDKLTEAQEAARAGVYARAMRGFIGWLCWRVNNGGADVFAGELRQVFQDKRRELLNAAAGYSGHDRLGTAGAHMLTGFGVMLDYFASVGAVDDAEREALAAEALAVVLEQQQTHAEEVNASDPLRMFAEAVEGLKTDPLRFLPVKDAALYSGNEKLCGYLDYMGKLYAIPMALFAAAQELSARAGTPIGIKRSEIWSRLYKAGITSTERAKTRHIPGIPKSQYVVEIDLAKLEALLEDDPRQGCNETRRPSNEDRELDWNDIIG